jgi:hypothetical protein
MVTQNRIHKIKSCILLTATINPFNTVFVKRVGPNVRENDYLNSLREWLKTGIFPIVFCENSNYNLKRIKSLLESCSNLKTECLQFNGRIFPKELGKGYGELLVIKYVLKNSSIINNCDFVIKVTGRYFISNIRKIKDALVRDKDIYVIADLKGNLTWADSRVFAFKPSFAVNYLLKYENMINDSKGFYLEHALGRAVTCAISDGYKWAPLPAKPFIIGYSGTYDSKYKKSKAWWLASEVVHSVKNYLNKRH